MELGLLAFACAGMVAFLVLSASRMFPGVDGRIWVGATALAGMLGLSWGVYRIVQWSGRSPSGSVEEFSAGVGAIVGGLGLFGVAFFRWRAARHEADLHAGGLQGLLGLVLMGAITAGVIVDGTLGTAVAVGAGICALVLLVRNVYRGDRAFQRVHEVLTEASHWPKPQSPGAEQSGWDPYEADRITGMYRGRTVWIAVHVNGGTIIGELPGWPHELTLTRRTPADAEDEASRSGDADFDDVFRIIGDDASWRPVLTPAMRAQLCALARQRDAWVEAGRLHLELPDSEVGALEVILDRVVELPAHEPDESPEGRVFALAADEPLPSVRQGHYRWLVARGWDVPRVLRTAADDSDPMIAAWARSELPPPDGAFR